MFSIFRFLQWSMVRWAVVVLSHFAMENAAANKWRVISELPTQRAEFATAVVDGKIYLIGGTLFEHARGVERPEFRPGIWRGPFGMSLVEVYDPETNTWQRLADIPTPRSEPMTAVVDGKIYVLAGYVGKDNLLVNIKHLKVVEMYDPQTDTWIRKQDMPTSRTQFGIGVVAGKIYAIGGYVHPRNRKPDEPWRLDLVETYDPATDTWAKRAKMPTRRDGFGAEVVRETIYAIGGSGWPHDGQGGPALATIEAYYPKTNRWRKKPDMPTLRWVFSTVVVAEKIYLIGGTDLQAGDRRLAPVEAFDPVTEKWRVISVAPAVRLPFSIAAVNGKIYVFGGYDKDWELSPIVEVFDTGFRKVHARGKLPTRWGQLKAEYHGQSQRD